MSNNNDITSEDLRNCDLGKAHAMFPCQRSNYGTNNPLFLLQSNHRKTVFALKENILGLIEKHGLVRIAILTLTLPRRVTDAKEAHRLFKPIGRKLTKRYQCWVRVFERMDSGSIHWHILILLNEGDIYSNVNFEEFHRKIYKSASIQLKEEWKFWRETASKFGFGRTQFMPIETNKDAVANYFAKYISKHCFFRRPEDKGAKIVRYSGNFPRSVGPRFSWFNPNAKVFWKKVGQIVRSLPRIKATPDATQEELEALMRIEYGPKWLFNLSPYIFREVLEDPSVSLDLTSLTAPDGGNPPATGQNA